MRVLTILLLAAAAFGQAGPNLEEARSTYVLGTGDQVLVRVMELEELGKEAYQVDMRGNINLPIAGRILARGMTLEQLENAIADRLKPVMKKPEVTVALHEMRSQPVSVLGAVRKPGVHQLQGQKTLLEVISLAEGLTPEAGYAIRIARRKEWGAVPLPGAKLDDSGQFYVAEVGVKEIMEARSPEKNIQVKPQDVITVPKGQMVYVMGAVKKSGAYVLGERERVTVLEALSMAEGCDSYANKGNAKVLRKTAGPTERAEIAVDLQRILEGKLKDLPMEHDDILFVQVSGARKALARTVEAAISVGTGVAVYRR